MLSSIIEDAIVKKMRIAKKEFHLYSVMVAIPDTFTQLEIMTVFTLLFDLKFKAVCAHLVSTLIVLIAIM